MGAYAGGNICTVSGNKMAYYRTGNGEPVLLVHGITTYSFIWRKIIPLLKPHYDVIAVDLLGCGDSDKPLDVSYAIKAHAERLQEFVDCIGIGRFHFVGHDLGGGIGQIFAVHHPGHLLDLAMINTVAYDLWPVQLITALRAPIIRQIMMSSMDLGLFEIIVRRGIYHKERCTPELMDLFMKPLLRLGGRKAFLHFANCLDNRNLLEIETQLRTLPLPVLIIRGEADPFLSAAISEKLHREISHSRLVRIPTGSHFLQEDEPEEISRALLSFFKGSVV